MVVAVAPEQAAIEPDLRPRRAGRHRALVVTQIVIVTHRFTLRLSVWNRQRGLTDSVADGSVLENYLSAYSMA
ncbi:hypothetical protein D3C75_1091160 [compost metagenome]